jgi:hypothetical protein
MAAQTMTIMAISDRMTARQPLDNSDSATVNTHTILTRINVNVTQTMMSKKKEVKAQTDTHCTLVCGIRTICNAQR